MKIFGYIAFIIAIAALALGYIGNAKWEREKIAVCQKENPGFRCEIGAHPIEAK